MNFSIQTKIFPFYEVKLDTSSEEIRRISYFTSFSRQRITKMDSFSIFSMNIWFEMIEAKQRFFAIVQLFMKQKPTIICLQECTPAFILFLHELFQNPKNSEEKGIGEFLIENYKFGCNLTKPHDVIMDYGVFFIIEKSVNLDQWLLYPLPNTTRFCGMLKFYFESQQVVQQIAIANVQFSTNSPQTNIQLTHLMQKLLSAYSHAFIVADFQDELHEWNANYRDAWMDLYGTRPIGFTMDTDNNGMLYRWLNNKEKMSRSDRILFKSSIVDEKLQKTWQCFHMEIVGTKRLDLHGSLFPSLHFGVYGCFVFEN